MGYYHIIFNINIANSQDVHFSQFETDRINLNPSVIGNLFENDFRFSL